jgi:lysophospholipid acyltransferase (LPLAT)-like uncharacterized protein
MARLQVAKPSPPDDHCSLITDYPFRASVVHSSTRLPVKIHELSRAQRWLVRLGSLLVGLLCATLRYRMNDRAGFLSGSNHGPVIVLLWHNRILATPVVFRRYYPRRKGIMVLTSPSRDGAYLAGFVGAFGMGAVRGSSSKRSSAALLDLVRRVNEGYDLAITPDGPRGPRYRLEPGALLIAQRCAAPLLPTHVEYSSYWRLKSWDGFAIPKPFSQVTVTLFPYESIPPDLSEADFQREVERVQALMTEPLVMK